MAALPSNELEALIARIADGNDEAWTSFVELFADLLWQVARGVERDRDAAADAFVHTCQRLRDRNAARLRTFDFGRAGRFDTWLRTVALNLCRDARRHRLGRFRPLASLQGLSPLEQRAFQLRYHYGFTFDQALAALAAEFPDLNEEALENAESTIAARLTPRDWWISAVRLAKVESLSEPADEGDREVPASFTSDPDWQFLRRESSSRLKSALMTLTPAERQLLRLRFREGVTLQRLATIAGFRDLQTADRRLKDILKRLRTHLETPS